MENKWFTSKQVVDLFNQFEEIRGQISLLQLEMENEKLFDIWQQMNRLSDFIFDDAAHGLFCEACCKAELAIECDGKWELAEKVERRLHHERTTRNLPGTNHGVHESH